MKKDGGKQIFGVIMPIYKGEQYIHRCVDGILAQTCKDFELLLADDGSPDNCPQICDEYARLILACHLLCRRG